MYTREQYGWIKHWRFMLLDTVCVAVSYLLAFVFRFKNLQQFSGNYVTLLLVMCVALQVISVLFNNLRSISKRSAANELVSVIELSIGLLAATILYIFTLHISDFYSRILIYLAVGIFAVLDYLSRLSLKKYLNSKPASANRAILVVCDSAHAETIIKEISEEKQSHYVIKAFSVTDGEKPAEELCQKLVPEAKLLKLDEAADFICREWIDEVLICGPVPQKFTDDCASMGTTVHMVLDVKNAEKHKQFVEEIGNHTVLTTAYNYIMPYQSIIKRCFDILGGLVGCIITAVLFIFVAPLIVIKSPGPVFFKQERIGRNGKHFFMYKFRSMYTDAEERKKEYLSQNRMGDGMMFKLDNDPRIIPGIGQFIRKTSIDEFPQFWNVLKGDMSLVGTRPPTLDEWEKYELHHHARLAIKPGITGMWQVSGRSDITDFEEVVRLDTEYICHFRLSLDLIIILKTVGLMFTHDGAM